MSLKTKIMKWNLISILSSLLISFLFDLIAARVLYVQFFGNRAKIEDVIKNPMFNSYCTQLFFVILGIFILTVIITSAILYYKISKSLMKPLEHLRNSTKEMSLGNFEYEFTYSHTDEIGDISSYLHELQNRLKHYINQITEQRNSSLEMISSISHDLKTPITTILGYTEGILDNIADNEERKRNYLLKIKKKALDLDNLMEQLLTAAKLDLNKISYQFETMDVIAYVTEIIDEIKIDLENNNITTSFIYEEKETFVLLDKLRFKRVLLNIVTNAIKYKKNEQGNIIIKFQNVSDSIVISFTDNGKGIEKEKLPFIFHNFYRCDDSRMETSSSSGLGLSIAKLIVEGHGGKIWARSTQGEGTSISISIPIKRG